ncbi:MAG: hypothetical protein ACI8U3_002493 [Brevundimonas sp.]|jgi:hypothetical protein|uniref:hypothetical protein n=1 Tax=Brevundimonas sp. TaxID=1871086 RepID=UPI0039E4D8FE
MFKVLIPAAGFLGLVALAAQPASSGYERQTDVQPMSWQVHHEGDLAKLTYGVPNSDQLAIMMTCLPGERSAVVYGDVQPDTPRLQRVSVNYSEPDPLSGGEAYETRIALDDAALTNLAERGTMRVEGAAGGFALPADEAEQAIVSQFVSYCSSARA